MGGSYMLGVGGIKSKNLRLRLVELGQQKAPVIEKEEKRKGREGRRRKGMLLEALTGVVQVPVDLAVHVGYGGGGVTPPQAIDPSSASSIMYVSVLRSSQPNGHIAGQGPHQLRCCF
jgi:hypothetical protein